MNFTTDMIYRLTPEERLLLKNLYDKVQETRPEPMQTEWQWTMRGPADEDYATRIRKGVPSPQLKAGKVTASALIQAARASEAGRASPVSLPALYLSTPRG